MAPQVISFGPLPASDDLEDLAAASNGGDGERNGAPAPVASASGWRRAATALAATAVAVSFVILGAAAVFETKDRQDSAAPAHYTAAALTAPVNLAESILACNQFMDRGACEGDSVCEWNPIGAFMYEHIAEQPMCVAKCKSSKDEAACVHAHSSRCRWSKRFQRCGEASPEALCGGKSKMLDGSLYKVLCPSHWKCNVCLIHDTPFGATNPDNQPFTTDLGVVDRKWCATRCNMKKDCHGFFYPFAGGTECQLVTQCDGANMAPHEAFCRDEKKHGFAFLVKQEHVHALSIPGSEK